MKSFFSISLLLVSIHSFSLHVEYNGRPINSVLEYKGFLNDIANDPRCSDYIVIRDRIASSTTIDGPLIGSNRGVLGAHHVGFKFNNGYDSRIGQTSGFRSGQFIFSDVYRLSSTDLAFPRFDEVNRTYNSARVESISQAYTPVTGVPILERASIDEIRDSRNSFYAFSNTLHGDNILSGEADRFTLMDFEYRNVVKCRPTLGDPAIQRTLRFDIDDAANFPIKFRTSHGDSVQPFFMITADNKLKVVGTHNPGGDHFSVENIAHPTTAAFIDKLIKRDIRVNALAAQGIVNPVEADINFNNWFKEINDYNGVKSAGFVNNLEEVVAPEPFSILTLGMGLGALIRNCRKNKNSNLDLDY